MQVLEAIIFCRLDGLSVIEQLNCLSCMMEQLDGGIKTATILSSAYQVLFVCLEIKTLKMKLHALNLLKQQKMGQVAHLQLHYENVSTTKVD